MIENRHWIALGLFGAAAVAIVLAATENLWLAFAACPLVFCGLACIAPRKWLWNDAYRRTLNVLAYASIIPAGVALAAAVGVTIFAVVVLPALCTFVFVTWRVKSPAPE